MLEYERMGGRGEPGFDSRCGSGGGGAIGAAGVFSFATEADSRI